jgi:hypothetical protein
MAGAAWKSGRGALGVLKPLLGQWATETEGPGNFGRIRVTRRFETVLGGAYVRLDVHWTLGGGKTYEEIALLGKGENGALAFTSFTSDGKQARGVQGDGSDVHPQAIAFQAQMPAGLARFVYWPADEGEGYYFAVENRTKKGWNRFLRHHYRSA